MTNWRSLKFAPESTCRGNKSAPQKGRTRTFYLANLANNRRQAMSPIPHWLWLSPPNHESLEQIRQNAALAPHLADPAALAVAHADLLLLNVYPYAGVYLEPGG